MERFKIIMWILIVQMLLNPFTVFVIVGCALTAVGPFTQVLSALVIGFTWWFIWSRLRNYFKEIDIKAMNVWIP